MWAVSKPASSIASSTASASRSGVAAVAVRQRRRVAEAGQVGREDVEALLEQWEHRPPAAPGVADAVDQDERIARSAAV